MTSGLGFLNSRQQFVSERLKVLTSRAMKSGAWKGCSPNRTAAKEKYQSSQIGL